MSRILLVEDDVKVAKTIRLYLEAGGFDVVWSGDGKEALELGLNREFELVILDIMLPGLDGLTVCRRLRAERSTPIILLTARTTENDRVKGLDLGADDYVPKPFSPRELMARVRAILRRTSFEASKAEQILNFEGLEIEPSRRAVRVRGQEVELTRTQFDLLWVLACRPGRVLSREGLIGLALGEDFEGSDRTVDVHIKNLRKRIEVDPKTPTLIETVFGVGYRFNDRGYP